MKNAITGGLLCLICTLCVLTLPITACGGQAQTRGGLSAASEISLEFLSGTLYLHTGAEQDVTAVVEIQNAGETGGTVTLTGPGRMKGPGMAQATPGPITFQVPLQQVDRYRAAITITLPAASAAYTYAATIVTAGGEKSATKTVKVCRVIAQPNPLVIEYENTGVVNLNVSPAITAAECLAQQILFELDDTRYVDLHAMCVSNYLGDPPEGYPGGENQGDDILDFGMGELFPPANGFSWGETVTNPSSTTFSITISGLLPGAYQHLRMFFAGTVAAHVLILVNDPDTKYIHYNIDYDNGGEQPDECVPQISNDNDLARVDFNLQIPTTGTLTLTLSGNLKVYNSANKRPQNLVILVGQPETETKSWNLGNETERNQISALLENGLFVEGITGKPVPDIVVTGFASLTLTLKDTEGTVVSTQSSTLTLIAATCGHGMPITEVWPLEVTERNALQTSFPELIGCEWSKTGNASESYNCIAWSVGETNRNYSIDSIERNYGGIIDGIITDDEMDAFYLAKKQWHPNAIGPVDAQAMYYPDEFHAAARTRLARPSCECGFGLWLMFESKIGTSARIEHVWDQLNGTTYGTPKRYYQ